MTLLGLFSSHWEVLLVLFVALLLFGSTKLPKLARSLGQSMTEFKKGLKSGKEQPKVEEPTNVDLAETARVEADSKES